MISLCYEKKFSEAFKLADSLFFTYQKHPSYWNQLASCYLIQGVERKAMLFFNKALEVMPMYVPALNNIGVIYHMNGQDQKSLVALEKALSQSKFSKTPRYNLAFLYLQYGLAIKAKDLFAGLVEESPADVEVRSGLANSYAMLKNWDSAIEEFMKIPDAERGRPEIGLNFSLAAYYSGKRDLALSIFKAVKVSPAYRAYANVVAKEIGESL
jgi:tetratricopeptide (TPR) repeat protein